MANEDIACPAVMKFCNCPTQAKKDGGRKTANSLFTTKARNMLQAVTPPEPKTIFQNLDSLFMG